MLSMKIKFQNNLEINNVLKGIFYVANKLYGLTFRECTDKFPVYAKNSSVMGSDR